MPERNRPVSFVRLGKEINFTPNGSGSADFNYSIKGRVIWIADLKLGTQPFTQVIEKVLRSCTGTLTVWAVNSGGRAARRSLSAP